MVFNNILETKKFLERNGGNDIVLISYFSTFCSIRHTIPANKYSGQGGQVMGDATSDSKIIKTLLEYEAKCEGGNLTKPFVNNINILNVKN